MGLAVGIDVGGARKGFHLAVIREGHRVIDALYHAPTPADAVRILGEQSEMPEVIGIDCPRRAVRQRLETRAAEREICARGFRIQWTRRNDPAEWMVHGEALWKALMAAFPTARCIECFPTIAGHSLEGSEIVLPLNILYAHRKQRQWKDFVDAAICAETAFRVRDGRDVQIAGIDDEQGPIYF